MTLTEISDQLQNPKNEAERVSAWGALLLYLEHDRTNEEAQALYSKYFVLGREWTSELVSTR